MAKPGQINSAEIISALQSGQMQILEGLYAAYREDFFRWAGWRFQGTRQDFEDAWQESIMAFYEQVSTGKLTELKYNIRTWLFAVGYKRLMKYNRKMKRIFWKDAIHEALLKDVQLFDFQWDDPQPDEWALVENGMQTLSPQCRDILLMRFYEGKKIPEIKVAFGHNSENTTSATLSRCLKKLKETVVGMMNDER